MSQGEIVRLADYGLDPNAAKFDDVLMSGGNNAAARARLADLIAVRNLWIAIAPPQISRSTVEEYSAFLQDTWRIHPRLTATFGRADKPPHPRPFGKTPCKIAGQGCWR